MTATETLRKAAALMRERAQASDEAWHDAAHFRIDGYSDSDAAHAASWHPLVALAVADWLEDTANDVTAYRDALAQPERVPPLGRALTVARAYLGGDPS